MARKKFVPKEPKYKVFTVNTNVIAMQIFKYTERTKIVLDCETKSGKPRRCIYWQFGNPVKVQVGDEVILTGRIDGDVFLVYQLLYNPRKRAENNSEVMKDERAG